MKASLSLAIGALAFTVSTPIMALSFDWAFTTDASSPGLPAGAGQGCCWQRRGALILWGMSCVFLT
ncbi:MAG: hypothetical protein HC919_02970 [Oscillatoriales cyanobacterium SM2_2_1]|nr:hypothetical protein [Oscillatoriales cyanobacterium SM2_2_1]